MLPCSCSFRETSVEFDRRGGGNFETELDVTEREYRNRSRPEFVEQFEGDYSTEPFRSSRFEVDEEADITVDPPRHRSSMGYYDDEGEYRSFRHGMHRAADRLLHPRRPHSTVREDIYISEEDRYPRERRHEREEVRYVERGRGYQPNTITIPCHHIRLGDIVMLQGRPSQVIRITTSPQTGQHRYLGVDLFSKQMHEDSSFISNPSPSVVVQNMLGPVFKQYRVLDIRDDGRVVAMTETGDVKQGLRVIERGALWERLNEAFSDGRGSVRVIVVSHSGHEMAVDYKVVHGSRL